MNSPFTKITCIDLPPLPLWSSFSELSEVLFPRLQTSFCPQENLTGKSHVVHVHAQYGTLCNRLEVFYHMLSSVQSLSRIQLFATPWTAACQASLSITHPQSLLKLMSIESVMPSNHLILCRPLLLPSIFPSIRVSSNESVLHNR